MINGINYQKFLSSFLETDIGKLISKDFDNITCLRGIQPSLEFKKRANLTFREIYGKEKYIVEGNTTISITTLYYLQFLLEKNPKQIYDIGCGWNIWKKYYPNIIGIDFEGKYADITDKFNNNFVDRYYEKLDAVLCVNMYLGLIEDENQDDYSPCVPVTFENYVEQILYFSQIIKPGGRAYISLNKLGFLKYTPKEWFIKNNVSRYDHQKLSQLLLSDLNNRFPYKILCFDCELDILDSMSFDGCVRLVFEKT